MHVSIPEHEGAGPEVGATGDLFEPAAPRVRGVVQPLRPLGTVRSAPAPAAVPARELWLALALPALPLLAVESAPAPLAVVDGAGAARRVLACNDAAARAGVRPGQKPNAAHALVPGLVVRERAPLAEERRLHELARWATAYTPCVSLEPPDGLLLEVRGSLRLFGGARALVERAVAELVAHGHAVRWALAPTPLGACWLARGASGAMVESSALLAGRLGALPLACTRWPARTLESFVRLGIGTLGELRRLPREGLARRFDPFVLADLDQACGLAPTPRRRHVGPERFQERLDLLAESGSIAELEPAFEQLLERLGRFLRVRNAGVTRIVLGLRHRELPPTRVPLGCALPCAEPREWRTLLRERLDRLVLPAPVLALTLRSAVAMPMLERGVALPGFEREAGESNAWALLDRLRARLGEAAVNGVCLVPEHRPEAAWRRVRPVPQPRARRASRAAARRRPVADPQLALPLAPRPLWLLAAPERLRVRQGQPQHEGGWLALLAGPERIESGWWDGQEVARDYYVAATRSGRRLWIYRERTAGEACWFLHGFFG